jgi:hypothetical protein
MYVTTFISFFIYIYIYDSLLSKVIVIIINFICFGIVLCSLFEKVL